MLALVVALRAEFDMGSGFTVPSQLAFVPLLFTMPPPLVPVAVVVALIVAYIPDVVRGDMQAVRLLRLLGSAWFSVGPAVVLTVFPATSPADAAPLVLFGALLAQLACDFGASAAMERLLHGAGLREQLSEAWVYVVDVALTPIGLLVAWDVAARPWAVLALIPLLLVLGTFGRERRQRVAGLVELNNAYRGTAMVLGDVVEADDGYTGEHSRGVVDLALEVGVASAWTTIGGGTSNSGRCCTTSARSRSRRRSSTSRARSTRMSGTSSARTRSRVSACSTASAAS